jgi:hypothetical protein
MTDSIARRAPGQLLARILDEPGLVRAVQSLEPRALGGLIERVGLEDAGELVALATTEQLQRIFDEDLWTAPAPGEAERFDPERFALWLEVMLEAGAERVAQRLTELSEELVTLAFQKMALVIDLDQLALEMSERHDDDDLVEKALEGVANIEIDEYRVMARRPEGDGWDAFTAVLLALDQDHHDFLTRLLERCCHATAAYVDESGGLYEVLTSEEMLESDAAAEREDRRTGEGFVAPTDAAAFLARARRSSLDELCRATGRDPITRAYFRDYRRPQRPQPAPQPATQPEALAESWSSLMEEVEAVAPNRPRLESGAAASPGLLVAALVTLAERDPDLHARRLDELGYLANVLVAGATIEGRRYRPVEAAEEALAICERGLQHLCGGDPLRAPERLTTDGADKVFSVGWHLLGR